MSTPSSSSPRFDVAVIGIGASGSAAARLALSKGETCHVSDLRTDARATASAHELRVLGADVDLGGHDLDRIFGARQVIVSPGIPPNAPVRRALHEAGTRWISEPEYAVGFHTGPLIAVTGTNGKTTTVLLTAHLLQVAGIDAQAAGNTGGGLAPPVSDAVREAEGRNVSLVLELSSFQLGGIRTLSPDVGIVTGLAPDHQDWYPSVEAYYADKARLFLNARADSRWVLNGGDPGVEALAGSAPGARFRFHDRRELPKGTSVSTGAADGSGAGDVHHHTPYAKAHQPGRDDSGRDDLHAHAYVARGEQAKGELADGDLADDTLADGELVIELQPGVPEPLLATSELQLMGGHNHRNALAAALSARLLGASMEDLRTGLRSFQPLPHRMEPVGREGGVVWVNDSKATNMDATRAALESVSSPVVLLLGGSDKGESAAELLSDSVARRLRAVVCHGAAGPRLAQELEAAVTWPGDESSSGDSIRGAGAPSTRPAIIRVDTGFDRAVAEARALAHPGDLLLLSPACASFDAFENYEARGRRFGELARARMPSRAGEGA